MMAFSSEEVRADLQASTSIRDFASRWNAWAAKVERETEPRARASILRGMDVLWRDGDPPRPIKLGDHVGWGPEGLLTYRAGLRIQVTPWERVTFTRDGRLRGVRR